MDDAARLPGMEPPVFLDCEASGWPPDGVAIEIAWGAPGGAIESYLVRPNWRWTYWSEQAEASTESRARCSSATGSLRPTSSGA
jgi:hypothetical protein